MEGSKFECKIIFNVCKCAKLYLIYKFICGLVLFSYNFAGAGWKIIINTAAISRTSKIPVRFMSNKQIRVYNVKKSSPRKPGLYLSCTAIFFTADRFRLLKRTRLTVVAFLSELPKTQHDISSVNVDVNTCTVSFSMILTLLSLELFTIFDILLFSCLLHRGLY